MGNGRLQRIGKGASIFASVRDVPSHVKAKARVLRRLATMLLLEGGIPAPALKEVPERFVQVTQGLLGRDTGHFIQPAIRSLALQPCQGRRRVAVEDVLPPLPIGIASEPQRPVEHETRRAKGPGKRVALARCGVASIQVGAFLFHTYVFFFNQAKLVNERRGAAPPHRSNEGSPPRKT